MSLSLCNTVTDESGRELVEHGTISFPIACYLDDFQLNDVPWHWHQELEAVVITHGSCVVMAGSQKFTLHAGEGFFINSQVLHGCWDTEKTGCKFHSLVFHPRLVGGSLDSIFHHNYLEPLMNHPSFAMVCFSPAVPWENQALLAVEDAWQQCTLEPEGYEFAVRHALSRLIYLLTRHMPPQQLPLREKNLRNADRIKTMLSFIHENFSSELSTASIAKAAMISESECLRCFHSTIGTTPIRYVKQYRIQQAAQLLQTTGHKISDIAAVCGFQDMSYFSKTFRQFKGCNPSDYRMLSDSAPEL